MRFSRLFKENTLFLLLPFCFILLLLPRSSSGYSYDLVPVGTRATGMSGAYTALARDASTGYWNPAGLVQVQATSLMLVGRSQWERREITPTGGTVQSEEMNNLAPQFIGTQVPFLWHDNKLALGMLYQRPMELVSYMNFQKTHPIEGGVVTYTPSLAYQATPWLAGGVAVNIWSGQRTFDENIQLQNLQGTVSREFTWEADYSGTNMTLGLSVDIADTHMELPVLIGLALRTPFELGIDYEDQTGFLDQPDRADSTSTFEYKIQQPLMISAGIAVMPRLGWTVALDYEYRAFADMRIFEDGHFGHREFALTAAGKDFHIVRVGTEYLLNLEGWHIPVRLGYRRVPTLASEGTADTGYDQVVGNGWSAGFGLRRDWYQFDVAYSSVRFHTDSPTREIEHQFDRVNVGVTLFLPWPPPVEE